MKNFRIFHLKTFTFLVVKFSVYLNRLVLVMFFGAFFIPFITVNLCTRYLGKCLSKGFDIW